MNSQFNQGRLAAEKELADSVNSHVIAMGIERGLAPLRSHGMAATSKAPSRGHEKQRRLLATRPLNYSATTLDNRPHKTSPVLREPIELPSGERDRRIGCIRRAEYNLKVRRAFLSFVYSASRLFLGCPGPAHALPPSPNRQVLALILLAMTDRVAAGYRPSTQQSGDPVPTQTVRIPVSQAESVTMNSREHSQMPPGPTYPSPNASQIGQGAISYYTNPSQRLTDDELHLSAELSREVGTSNVAEGPANGMPPHGPAMGLAPSQAAAPDTNRGPAEHHQQQSQHPQQAQTPGQTQPNLMQFTQNQQVGVDPNHELSYGEQSARRKRSKISRACDECRRKKVSKCSNRPSLV